MTKLSSFSNLISALEPVNDRIRVIAIGLVAVFFVAALIHDHFYSIQGNSSRGTIIFKLILFFAFLSAYRIYFLRVEEIGSGISGEIFSEAEFTSFVGDIWSGMSQSQAKLDGVWGILKGGVTTVAVSLSYLIAVLAYKVLQIGKILSMGILFTLGPLVLAASVLPGAGRLTVGLATNVIAVASWPIVGNLLLRLLKEMGMATYYANPENFVPLIAANITFAFSLMMVPSICSALIRGGGLGTSGSVIGLSTLTAAISPLSYSWMKLRDMAWNKGSKSVGNVMGKLSGKNGANKMSALRPGDRMPS